MSGNKLSGNSVWCVGIILFVLIGRNAFALTNEDIKKYFTSLHVSSEVVNKIVINNYKEPTLDETKLVTKKELFGDVFTADNTPRKLESIAKYMHDTLGSQFIEGDWIESMKVMSPNGDEADVLNLYYAGLDELVDPFTAWQGATKLMAVKRFPNHLDILLESQKATMQYLLVDNIYSIIKALKPELLKNTKRLTLPKIYQEKSYRFIETSYEIVSVVNKLLPQKDKIRAENITDFKEVYAEVLEAGRLEYIDTYLASDEAQEDGVTRDEMEEEYLELIDYLQRDVYENDFPELIVTYAPNLGKELVDLLPLIGSNNFADMLVLTYRGDELKNQTAKIKAEREAYADQTAKIKAEREAYADQTAKIKAEREAYAEKSAASEARGDKYARNTEEIIKNINGYVQIRENFKKMGIKEETIKNQGDRVLDFADIDTPSKIKRDTLN